MIAATPTKPGPKEQLFLAALRDIFIGVKIDGQSGYINLMRIKAAYFSKVVEPQLLEDIGKALTHFPDFREELFDKLHAFFSRYFSRSGSICFAYTPQHMSVYEKVYTDEQDVVLFWKTHMLYYVKTDRLFRDLSVDIDGQVFFFDCSELQHKKANEKRELVFTFSRVEPNGTIRLLVTYSERGRGTKTDEILRAAKDAERPIREAALDKALKTFSRQSEVDYFINKDAKGFLREQFDLWMYQYIFKGETAWTEQRIRQLQVLKDIACKLIDFISQFEDELVRIWNKPKFVRGSFYVITLDRVAARPGGVELLGEFLRHSGMKDQGREWHELGMVEKDFEPKCILESKGKEKTLSARWRSLPLDTRNFKSIELKLLSLFDNLDEQIDGRLIKSENYQALNTLKEKFRGRVKTIYIDPPYNTGSDDFLYKDDFRHASWVTLVSDRIARAHELLGGKGVIFISIDAKERRNLESVCGEVFGSDNRVEEIIWAQNTTKNQSPTYSTNHEYVEVYAKDLRSVASDERMFREPRPGLTELQELAERLSADFPPLRLVEEQIAELFEYHRAELREELEDQGIEYERNLDPWKGLYNYSKAEYRDEDGRFVPEGQARAKSAKLWIWQEGDASMPAGKQADSTRQPEDPNYRFYRPLHPLTKRPCKHPKRGWCWPYHRAPEIADRYTFDHANEDHRIFWGPDETKIPRVKKFLQELDSQVAKSVVTDFTNGEKQLTDIMGVSGTFPNPKPTTLISRFVLQTADAGDWVMDFFAGSGTTAHAVAECFSSDKTRRRFLIVDGGRHFDSVILPRTKKAFSATTWRGGRPENLDGIGLFCKVSSLEQYEDTLSTAAYSEEEDLFRNSKTDPYSQYLFFRDVKLAKALELDYKRDEVKVHLERLYPDIDLAETLSCVTGKWIKRVTEEEVEFADGTVESLKKPDWRLLKPLIFWGPVV